MRIFHAYLVSYKVISPKSNFYLFKSKTYRENITGLRILLNLSCENKFSHKMHEWVILGTIHVSISDPQFHNWQIKKEVITVPINIL